MFRLFGQCGKLVLNYRTTISSAGVFGYTNTNNTSDAFTQNTQNTSNEAPEGSYPTCDLNE